MALSDENTPWRKGVAIVLCAWPLLLVLMAFDPIAKTVPAFLKPLADLPLLPSLAVVFAAAALSAALFALTRWIRTRLQIHRLRTLGHGFDAAHYLDLLSKNRKNGTLVVKFGFSQGWEDARQKSTQAAVHLWMPELKKIAWTNASTLELRSRNLSTIELGTGARSSGTSDFYFTNQPVHDCFANLIKRVLPKLDAAVPVQHLEVDIEGDTLPWYARAR
ncbi:MAG: hypothetical protein JST05_08815 [Acidobacteria bacterium]|nr:hypothetical protein [Acidobacteriota bacterium]